MVTKPGTLGEEDEVKVTEFELQLWRVFYGFLRWQEECEKSANGTQLSGNELAILHIVRLKNRSKTITDIERLLNRDDVHNIRYSLNKLLKLGLIKKTLSNYNGKNYLFEVTEAGIKDTDNFLKLRKSILVNMFKELNLDLEEMIKNLTKIKAVYDEADRSVTQNFMYSTYPKDNQHLEESAAVLGRILVVEDHPTAAKITKKILSDLNYQVDIASSGDMAINLTEEHHCDIIFMDIGLPDIDGCEITRKIRSNKNSKNTYTPIIGLTAHVSNENKRDCIEAGMNAVFTKPLIKEKVADIFAMFVSKPNEKSVAKMLEKTDENQNTQNGFLSSLKGNVIDLSQGAQLVGGNEALAKEAIEMLVESFSEELAQLEQTCITQDIVTAQIIIHKLRGGVSYCGVPRLNEVCARFDEYLKSGKHELMQDLFNLLQFELNKVKEQLLTVQW